MVREVILVVGVGGEAQEATLEGTEVVVSLVREMAAGLPETVMVEGSSVMVEGSSVMVEESSVAETVVRGNLSEQMVVQSSLEAEVEGI